MPADTILLRDQFPESAAPGSLVRDHAASPSDTPRAPYRSVIDRHGVIGVDHAALRIGWFPEAGWGRAAVGYGPFAAVPGLAARVRIEHGLPTSKLESEVWTDPADVFASLAVGFYDQVTPRRPDRDGATFVFDAHDGADARLLAGGMVALERLQNLVFDLLIVRRTHDVAYLVSSFEGVPGAVAFGQFALVGFGPAPAGEHWTLGIHQRVLGEVDYRVDTRVHDVCVAQVDPSFLDPLIRSRLSGRGSVSSPWVLQHGRLEQGPRGAGAVYGQAGATVKTDAAIGLVRAQLGVYGPSAQGALTVEPVGVRATVGASALRMEHRDASGQWHRRGFVSSGTIAQGNAAWVDVAVSTNARASRVRVDGRDLIAAPIAAAGTDGTDAVTLDFEGTGFRVGALEAYPAVIDGPAVFAVAPPWQAEGTRIVVRDAFEGPVGPLDTRTESPWHHLMGAGRFLAGDGAARVDASRVAPNPGRTIYGIKWDDPGFVDLSVSLAAPGRSRHSGHMARGGFCVWESPLDYVLVNYWLDDGFPGSSVSMFVHAHGTEPVWEHDATWTNAGARIQPGRAMNLRLVTDGEHFLVHLDNEPVLWRRRSDVRVDADPLRISAVGLVANWEWGDDTGSVFRDFVARGRA